METEAEPLIPVAVPPTHHTPPPPPSNQTPPTSTTAAAALVPWIPLAAASGACAAFNGVFAKLTTTELTSSWAAGVATALGLSEGNKVVEVVIRGFFFILNLSFNATMWALFTAALTRASSTTRVSIVNTSANFLLTAFAGWMVFGEKVPGLWWVGAAGLLVGNVVIGRREEEGDARFQKKKEEEGIGGRELVDGEIDGYVGERYRDREGEEDVDGGRGDGAISDGVELDEAKVKR